MFDPFKIWDEMLDIYEQTVAKKKDESEVEYISMDVDIPAELEEEFVAMVDDWLQSKGF